MTLTPRLDLRQAQSLTMTQRLRQAIDLLQMSALDVENAVNAELEKNPFLEREGDLRRRFLNRRNLPMMFAVTRRLYRTAATKFPLIQTTNRRKTAFTNSR